MKEGHLLTITYSLLCGACGTVQHQLERGECVSKRTSCARAHAHTDSHERTGSQATPAMPDVFVACNREGLWHGAAEGANRLLRKRGLDTFNVWFEEDALYCATFLSSALKMRELLHWCSANRLARSFNSSQRWPLTFNNCQLMRRFHDMSFVIKRPGRSSPKQLQVNSPLWEMYCQTVKQPTELLVLKRTVSKQEETSNRKKRHWQCCSRVMGNT